MANSTGTIGQTVIKTSQMLEHAMSRCGLKESAQTPRVIKIALENLFLLLVSLSSRGLNLWAIDSRVIGLITGKATYVLPPGTIDVLNVLHSQPTLVTGTPTVSQFNTTTVLATLPTATTVSRVGITASVGTSNNSTMTLIPSTDGLTFNYDNALPKISEPMIAGRTYYYDLNGAQSVKAVLFICNETFSASAASFAASTYDQKMSPFNRDDYTAQPQKTRLGKPSTNYFFEKLVDPQLTVWPLPPDSTCQVLVWRHRQIQDIGSLRQSVEIPNRWLDPIIWQLARRLCFEVPGIQPDKIQMVMTESDKYLLEGEMNESDHSPIFLTPRISAYTK